METQTRMIEKLVEDVSYLRGKIDATFPQMEKTSADIKNIIDQHQQRIDKLNNFEIQMKTKVTIYGGIAGFVLGVIGTWVSKHFWKI